MRNVLLCLLDDLAPDYLPAPLGWGSHPLLRVPTISRLADSGRVVHMRTEPACSQSRADWMTGQRPRVHGIGQLVLPGEPPLDTAFGSLATDMVDRGMATWFSGKWHLGDPAIGHPIDLDWQRFSGTRENLDDYREYEWFEQTDSSTIRAYATSFTAGRAIDLLSEVPTSQPWCGMVSFHAPHQPFHRPPRRLYSPDNPCSTELEQFLASLEAVDAVIANLLAAIPPSVLAETLVVISGDNGTPKQVTEIESGNGKGTTGEGGTAGWAILHQLGTLFPSGSGQEFAFYELREQIAQWIETGTSDLTHAPAPSVDRVVTCERFKPNGVAPPSGYEVHQRAAILRPWKLRRDMLSGHETFERVFLDSFDEPEIEESDVPPAVREKLRAAIE